VRTVIVFIFVIGTPLFYLWEHAYSFGQCQRIARLREERHRLKEVCDSLQADVANYRSDYRIGSVAVRMGLETRYATIPLSVPVAIQQSAEKSRHDAASKKPGRIGPVASAGESGAGVKSKPGKTTPARSAQLTSLAPTVPKKAPGEM
jgi:hypothetical protein